MGDADKRDGQPVRVLLADDHNLVRESLVKTVSAEPDFIVVGEAATGTEVLPQVLATNPHILVLDIAMPGEDGLSVAAKVRKQAPDVRVLFMTMHDDDSHLKRAMALDVAGFVSKRASADEFIEALQAVASGASVHVLVHSLLSADPALDSGEQTAFEVSERSALLAATSVTCVSQWSAEDVRERHHGVTPGVAPPGCDPVEEAKGSTPPQLLVLAALIPLKNQASVLRVMRDLADEPWTLQLVGSDVVDSDYSRQLRILAADLPPGRVTFHGALTGPALDAVWNATDLLLLTSMSETYAMVVTEALARGIPAVVPANTGAVEALLGSTDAKSTTAAGAVVDPLDEAELGRVVRKWLTSPDVRNTWSAAATQRRLRLKPWTSTAHRLLEIIRR